MDFKTWNLFSLYEGTSELGPEFLNRNNFVHAGN